MAKGICPECGSLEDIYTRDEPIGWHLPRGGSMALPTGSACWWYTCVHPDRRVEPDAEGRRPFCKGGKI